MRRVLAPLAPVVLAVALAPLAAAAPGDPTTPAPATPYPSASTRITVEAPPLPSSTSDKPTSRLDAPTAQTYGSGIPAPSQGTPSAPSTSEGTQVPSATSTSSAQAPSTSRSGIQTYTVPPSTTSTTATPSTTTKSAPVPATGDGELLKWMLVALGLLVFVFAPALLILNHRSRKAQEPRVRHYVDHDADYAEDDWSLVSAPDDDYDERESDDDGRYDDYDDYDDYDAGEDDTQPLRAARRGSR